MNQPSPLRVLAVDDEEWVRTGLMRALSSMGHECAAAATGAEAIAMHRERPFDVIVSDWSMPDGDGIELCRHVREGAKRYTYFILCTAHHEKARMLEGLQAGADDFIPKPIDIDYLEVRLAAAKRIIDLQNTLLEKSRSARRDSRRMYVVSRIDPLTGLRNRRSLDDDLPRFVEDATRYERKYSCAMFDIDEFKLCNDAYGHPAGDEVLRRVTDTIRTELRTSDLVFRYGGEEFLAVLPQQSAETAARAVERVLRAIENLRLPHALNASRPYITVSAGVAELEDDPLEWIARADIALYEAKRTGRNRVVIAR